MRTQIEIDQRLDWLCQQFARLKQRVEQLERERLTVAVSPTKKYGYGVVTQDPQTGEFL